MHSESQLPLPQLQEGVNGNVSVPSRHIDRFGHTLRSAIGTVPFFNYAVGEAAEQTQRPFSNLHVRWRPSLAAMVRAYVSVCVYVWCLWALPHPDHHRLRASRGWRR